METRNDDDAALVNCNEERPQIPTGDAFVMITNMLLEADMIDSLTRDEFATSDARLSAQADAKQIHSSYPGVQVRCSGVSVWDPMCVEISLRSIYWTTRTRSGLQPHR